MEDEIFKEVSLSPWDLRFYPSDLRPMRGVLDSNKVRIHRKKNCQLSSEATSKKPMGEKEGRPQVTAR